MYLHNTIFIFNKHTSFIAQILISFIIIIIQVECFIRKVVVLYYILGKIF